MSDSGGAGANRTVFRPSPLQNAAGAAGAPASAPAAPASAAPSVPRRLPPDDVPSPPFAASPRNAMMGQAGPLLALLASVASGRARILLPELHGRVSADIAAFDAAVRGRYPDEFVQRAKYALCASADDVALNLHDQQADAAEWARRSMMVRFFGENIGGDRFWRLLDEMIARPAEFGDLLELYHACMAAGFLGRYRVMPDGRRAHQEMMQRVHQALQHTRTLSMTELSPRWKGEAAPLGRVGFWGPLAVAASASVMVLVLIYIVLRLMLAQSGEATLTAVRAINPDQPLRLSRSAPAAAAPDAGPQAQRLRTFLAPEIAAGLVAVVEDPSTVRVRTTVGQLFASGSDQLDPERRPLIDRIAEAVDTEPGPVRVEGFTDSDRVSNVSFPDNMALSQARAEVVAAIVRARLSDPSRLSAEGFGDAQAIASNDSAEGKARNRRVEIVIRRGS